MKRSRFVRTCTCSIFSLILVLASCTCLEYLILPIDQTQCPEELNCTTLEHLSSKNFSEKDVSLQFLNATYVMDSTLEIIGAIMVRIIGYRNSTSIVCQQQSALNFLKVPKVEIMDMKFLGCGDEQLNNRGIVSAQTSETLLIFNCHFVNTRFAASIFASGVNTTTIANSTFKDNSACSTCNGGVISIQSESIFVINCLFENNVAQLGGGIYVRESTLVSVINSYFKGNRANAGGAVFLSQPTNFITERSQYVSNVAVGGGALGIVGSHFSSKSCLFNRNLARSGGAVLFLGTASINAINTHFIGNTACFGGALSATSGSMYSGKCVYAHNKAILCPNASGVVNKDDSVGGAILFAQYGSLTSQASQYSSNTATHGGSASVQSGTIKTSSDMYSNNIAGSGGAISLVFGTITTQDSSFINNIASDLLGGGAIYISDGTIHSNDSQFISNASPQYGGGAILIGVNGSAFFRGSKFLNNSAGINGGAVYIWNGSVVLLQSVFSGNKVDFGGGTISLSNGTVISDDSEFERNQGGYGGVIYIMCGSMISNNSSFIENRARFAGGAIYITHYVCASSVNTTSVITQSRFENNFAVNAAAALYLTMGDICIEQTTISGNTAGSQSSSIYLGSALAFIKDCYFQQNNGSLHLFNTQLELHGRVSFVNNSGLSGGAIHAAHSQVYIIATSNVTIRKNIATFGGGVWFRQSTLHVNESIIIEQNRAEISGGGVYAYQSTLEFKCDVLRLPRCLSQVADNVATLNGGGIFAIGSSMILSQSFVKISSNKARGRGGGVYLEQTSKIYIFKNEYEEIKMDNLDSLYYRVRLDIAYNNAGTYGGGLYVSDSSNAGLICRMLDTETYDSTSVNECFIQTLELYDTTINNRTNNYNTFVANNTASITGAAIFGGLLDRCSINPSAEVLDRVHRLYLYNISSGFDYIKTTVQIEEIIDYKNINFTNTLQEVVYGITKDSVKGLVSSDAVQVVFCEENSTLSSEPLNIFVKKGERFMASVMAVDDIGNPANSTIISSTSSHSGVSRLKEGQAQQLALGPCTHLQYNVFSEDDTAQVILYADGPCKDIGISKQVINVNFSPCTCPVGFMPANSRIECICECVEEFIPYDIICLQERGVILVETDIWIGVSSTPYNETNETSYAVLNCPFDYCAPKPINISLASVGKRNKQCANNRTGTLCGKCEEGLSLVFASSRCLHCSNFYVLLILAFALGGTLIVGVILLLNLTMAVGTLHGLIFYANLLQANSAVFMPFRNFLTIFISWLNLDLGIETCFYNGMSSQAKVLLQLAFPVYMYLLVVLIIILSKHSTKFSALLAKRNPVAALCTLIFLSYSKLLRIVISALQFTYLYFSDGHYKLVWLYDANIQYFDINHTPRFVAAFAVILLGSLYSIVLYFGQWFSRCSEMQLMKWTQNTKYHAFIDVYHAPFQPKHRYWTGLLLLLLILNNLFTAILQNAFLTVVLVGCTAFLLILLKLFTGRIYKNKAVDALETFFLANLILLSAVTVFIRKPNEVQQKVSNTSMGLSFIFFLFVLGYHFHTYLLQNTRLWDSLKRFKRELKRRENAMIQPPENEDAVQVGNNEDYHLDTINLYAEERTDTNATHGQLPQDITPPIIQSAVHYDRLREPDLDILGPITEDDYMVPARKRENEPPIITYSVVDVAHRK